MTRKPDPHTISPFVEECSTRITLPESALVLDLPCGFGRHTRFFASLGCHVIGLDIDEGRLARAKDLSVHECEHTGWVAANIERTLPLKDAVFDLVVVVHYVSPNILAAATTALKPGGYLIFETFDARGGNWQALPRKDEVSEFLFRRFEIVQLRERHVGPKATRAVVRALARRRS
jgi:SAM-dependent methyltransferase